MHISLKIAFIGGGNMASALIGGLLQTKIATAATADAETELRPELIHVVDAHAPTLSRVQSQWGVQTSLVIDDQIRNCDVIVFAVKPQNMREVIDQCAPFIEKQLLISVAAGVRAETIASRLNAYRKIVRAMPNTPALIGLGMSGLFALDAVSEDEKNLAQMILAAVGETLWVDQESLIDAVTAVSGSGPAYVFYFIEAMQAAACELGLSPAQAQSLALATFNGAAQLAKQSEESIASLRERVTSKGGTTYAALTSMEQSAVKPAIVLAIKAAALRGQELGDAFAKD